MALCVCNFSIVASWQRLSGPAGRPVWDCCGTIGAWAMLAQSDCCTNVNRSLLLLQPANLPPDSRMQSPRWDVFIPLLTEGVEKMKVDIGGLNFVSFGSFLEQRLLALEARHGMELRGLEGEKRQLQELLESQSRMVSQLQGELGGSRLNSTLLQRQQAVLADSVQQLMAMVNHCNGNVEGVFCTNHIVESRAF